MYIIFGLDSSNNEAFIINAYNNITDAENNYKSVIIENIIDAGLVEDNEGNEINDKDTIKNLLEDGNIERVNFTETETEIEIYGRTIKYYIERITVQ